VLARALVLDVDGDRLGQRRNRGAVLGGRRGAAEREAFVGASTDRSRRGLTCTSGWWSGGAPRRLCGMRRSTIRGPSWWGGMGEPSASERREADEFLAELLGEPLRRQAFEAAEDAPPEWLAIARRLPVTYTRPQRPMEPTILGVVVHTTNHAAGPETLERFQADWQGLQHQSAHFAVDREGNIGQYRSTREVAWHINTPSTRYFGIEHIAKHRQELTEAQLERSARLIGDLASMFRFPAQRFDPTTKQGIAIHIDFAYTGCGQDVFWNGPSRGRSAVYDRLVRRAHDFATLGY
jgi:hypothetical protein